MSENVNENIQGIKELTWQKEGKRDVDRPQGAYDDNHAEGNEVCYP